MRLRLWLAMAFIGVIVALALYAWSDRSPAPCDPLSPLPWLRCGTAQAD